MGEVAVGVGAVPGGEGIGGEAGVDHSQGAFEVRFGEVGVVFSELGGGEHSLVDEAGGGHEADIELFAGDFAGGAELDEVFGALSDEVESSVEVGLIEEGGTGGDEHLSDEGFGATRGWAEDFAVNGDIAPAENDEVVVAGGLFEDFLAFASGVWVSGQEGHSDGVLSWWGEGDAEFFGFSAEEAVGCSDEDAGAVAAVGFGADGAAVVHILEHEEGVGDDFVGGFALDVADEADATGFVFEAGVVEPLCRG